MSVSQEQPAPKSSKKALWIIVGGAAGLVFFGVMACICGLVVGTTGAAKEQEAMAQECESGNAESCVRLATRYMSKHNASPEDETRARELMTRSCELGPPSANVCSAAAQMWSTDEGGPADFSKVRWAYSKACDMGDLDGCGFLANQLAFGPDISALDPARAFELGERGCAADHLYSCQQLGMMYQYGTGVEADPPRASELFEEGCRRGRAQACFRQGYLSELGRGVELDMEKARRFYQKSCDGKHQPGCERISRMDGD